MLLLPNYLTLKIYIFRKHLYKNQRKRAKKNIKIYPHDIYLFQACDKTPTDEHQLQYDEFNPFDICPETYTPIYRGQENECCPFCGAKYQKRFKGQVCKICKVGLIGKYGQGLKIRRKIR